MNDRKNTLPDTYKTKPDVPQTEPLRKAVQNARRLRRKKRYTLLASFFMVAAFAAIGFFAFFELSKHRRHAESARNRNAANQCGFNGFRQRGEYRPKRGDARRLDRLHHQHQLPVRAGSFDGTVESGVG